jgi:LDH2 family malate/lactate/ureidoglycolate dehydrogenase
MRVQPALAIYLALIMLSLRATIGMLVMNAACELAVKKAQEHGFGIVATHGTSSGTGAIGYFGHSIAKR